MTFKTLIVATLSLLAMSSASAFDEVDQAAAVLSQHTMNCQAGSRGWWLKLDSQVINHHLQGGVSASDGRFWGCGTCGECRTKMNQQIDSTLSGLSKYCKDRGGEIKRSERGQWKEDVKEKQWDLKVDGVTITCEKWIEC